MEIIKIVKKKKKKSWEGCGEQYCKKSPESHENQYYHKKPQKMYGNYKSFKKLQESKDH